VRRDSCDPVPWYNGNFTCLHVQKRCKAFFHDMELKRQAPVSIITNRNLQAIHMLTNLQGWRVIMKIIMAALLLLVSTSLLADRPPCSLTPGGCVGNPPGLGQGNVAAVPEPGSLALTGLGIAGLLVARRRKR
jgi:hypothetical protein